MKKQQRFKLNRTNKCWLKVAMTSVAVFAGVTTVNITTIDNNLVKVQIPTVNASTTKINRRTLQKQVTCGYNFRESGYTKVSFSKLQMELKTAQQILVATNISQNVIDDAVKNVHTAIINLVANTDDPKYLQQQLAKIITKPVTASDFQKNIYICNLVLASEGATAQQREVASQLLYQNSVAVIAQQSYQKVG